MPLKSLLFHSSSWNLTSHLIPSSCLWYIRFRRNCSGMGRERCVYLPGAFWLSVCRAINSWTWRGQVEAAGWLSDVFGASLMFAVSELLRRFRFSLGSRYRVTWYKFSIYCGSVLLYIRLSSICYLFFGWLREMVILRVKFLLSERVSVVLVFIFPSRICIVSVMP